MARAGRKDRGLLSRMDTAGKKMWYVRLWRDGKERRFGSFPTKTKACEFYEKAKLEQKEDRFFPKRYHHGSHVLVEELLTRQAKTTTVKNQAAEKHYMAWWKERLKGVRLNHVTAAVIEDAQRSLIAQNLAPQTVLHYVKSLRHVLNNAVRDRKLDRNPFARVQLVKVQNGRQGFSPPTKKPVCSISLGRSMGRGLVSPFSRDSGWANSSGYDGRMWIWIGA